MAVGRIREIWRYPVKSMEGERLESCAMGELGIPGDRGWALRDERAGEIRNARKLPGLLLCRAHYPEEPSEARIPAAEMMLPDGTRLSSDAPDAGERLSEYLGRPVTLWPRLPADQSDHYLRGAPDQPDFEKELREIMDRTEDEPLPNFAGHSPDLLRFTCPPGTYFDAFPVQLLTTASLRRLVELHPGSDADPRRFRPNLVIESDAGEVGPVEADWLGHGLRIGSCELRVELPTVRCNIPGRAQRDLPADPAVSRAIVRGMDQNLGIYASVTTPGRIAEGDSVECLE